MGASQPALAARGRSEPRLSIGQVLQRISGEFPHVTPSKLRFLEDQGLIHPARSASGYRKFSQDDVDRIRRILTLQRDQYLPLKVIGEMLDGPAPEGDAAPPVPVMLRLAAPRPLVECADRRELAAHTGASAQLIDQAVSAALIPPAGPYGATQVELMTSLVELAGAGIEPRHLRAFRTAAHHELGLIERATSVAPRGEGDRTADRAHRIADQLATVRSALVRSALESRSDDRPRAPRGSSER